MIEREIEDFVCCHIELIIGASLLSMLLVIVVVVIRAQI